MRSRVFAAAAGSVVALAGFAGAANASATIDLIWADTGTNQISNVNTSSIITLQVILTAGPGGSAGAGVSVDYGGVLPKLTVLGYASTPGGTALPFALGSPTDTGTRIENFSSVCLPPFPCTGLMAGESHQLGTVTFHKSVLLNGIFEIQSDANGPIDAVLNLAGAEIQSSTTFNSAFLINVIGDPPGCDFVIEINALRGGSPTVTVNTTKNITAKARIAKGTAPPDTTIDVTLQIDAVVGGTVVDTQSSSVRLEVGKGGQGDKLGMLIRRADCKPRDSIDFVATFSGTDVNGSLCEATRRITKTCK